MPYEVLARKWRPQQFEDVVGQEHIAKTLVNALKMGRLAHAYLFAGPRGVGKTSVARILAKVVNCQQGDPGIPCNHCPSCLQITDGSSVDVQEIDGASNRGIDEIRELRENIKYMPSSSQYRIYIIDEVHMLTKEAFNALLKTLEEPPSHVKFIFATTEAHKVPVTILSRCQRFDFKRIPVHQIVAHLEKIVRQEGIRITRSALELIAREAEGSMRDAESLLDQLVSFAGSDVEESQVSEILGVIDSALMFDVSQAVIDGSYRRCLELVDQIYRYGYDLKEFYRALMEQFRNLLVSLMAPQEEAIFVLGGQQGDNAEQQAEKAGFRKLQLILNFLISHEEDLRFSSHPRLILEATLIKLCDIGDYFSFGELLKKIESLEKRLASQSGETEIGDADISKPLPHMETQGEVFDGDGNQPDWDSFLSYLSSKNKVMFSILKDWQVLRLDHDTLVVAKSPQTFSSTYFDDNEKFDQLLTYCKEFFKRDITLQIETKNTLTKPGAETDSSAESGCIGNDTPENRLSKPVQEILHMFQGELRRESTSKHSKAYQEVKK